MRNYKYENGRRYHRFREGTYNFPNDEMEQDREDLKHALVVKLCQAWYFAPIHNMQYVTTKPHLYDVGVSAGTALTDAQKYFRHGNRDRHLGD
jgi:hypothetical protein